MKAAHITEAGAPMQRGGVGNIHHLCHALSPALCHQGVAVLGGDDGEGILAAQILPNDIDRLRVIHFEKSFIALSSNVAILVLEIDQGHLVLVLHQHKPIPVQLLQN